MEEYSKESYIKSISDEVFTAFDTDGKDGMSLEQFKAMINTDEEPEIDVGDVHNDMENMGEGNEETL